MSKKLIATIGVVVGLTTCLAAVAFAGIPFAPFSTCAVSIVQSPIQTKCINNWNPDVVRLCPSLATPVFDSVTFTLTILDALAAPVFGATLTAYETSGVVNIANGGTATTNALGQGSITVSQGGGYGRMGVCAAGVLICEVAVRSNDPAFSNAGTVAGCTLPTAVNSVVNANDVTNPSCGFAAKFGVVTVGVNESWDLDCTNIVNFTDVLGVGGKSGVTPHFLHLAILGAKTTCP
jgi:hypothetical protein